MKQIFTTNLGVKVMDAPIPMPDDNEIQVEIFNSLISVGTESSSMKSKTLTQKYQGYRNKIDKALKLLKGEGFKIAYEKVVTTLSNSNIDTKFRPIGYSNSGVVVAKGKNVTSVNVGDRVACAGNGFAVHGEIAVVPKNLVVKLPAQVSFEQAAFTTVGSIAMQGIRRANVQPGEWIIIYGVGLLGLLAVQIAKAWGLRVIAIDINEDKLKLAKEFGADEVINSLDSDDSLNDIVYRATDGYGADASLIYASTTSSELVNKSFELCREKGTIVIVGAVGMDLIRDDFYRKEQNLLISTSYGPGRYDDDYEIKGNDYPIGYVRWTENRNMQEFVHLLDKGQIDIDRLLTSTNDVANATEIYRKLGSAMHDEIGVLFNFKTQDESSSFQELKNHVVLSEQAIKPGQIGVGVIGAGGYVKGFILPYMKDNDKYSLRGLSNKTSQSSLEAGKNFGFKYLTGDYRELLDDQEISLIIIGTRHNLHAEITLEALQKGKNVFVEKPLSLTLEGVEHIIKHLDGDSTRLFIGFNRRYSDLTQRIRRKLEDRRTPVMINFRINAGHIPKDSWIQDPTIGGGRIIGEACHFVDLCNYLIADEIKSFDIKNIPVDHKGVIADDNFVITINYEDGSLANIVYTAIGGKTQAKELLEVFSNGKSYVIDDFIKYHEYSDGKQDTVQLKEQDKGREVQIEEIYKTLNNSDSLIPHVNYDINASLLTIRAQEKLYGIK